MSTFLRSLLALLFLTAGILHLARPDIFLQVMPRWVPMQLACIYLSGLCELAGGAGLLLPPGRGRAGAGLGLMLLLIAVFPVNLEMALHGFRNWWPWALWLRVPFQFVLIWAVWRVSRQPCPTC